jgi:hypothetical protein
MSVMPITVVGDPVPRTPAAPLSPGGLEDPDTQRFIDDLIEMFDRYERRAFEVHARVVVERWGS